MLTKFCQVCLFILLLAICSWTTAEELKPYEILEKAIAAHGGERELTRLKAIRLQGTAQSQKGTVKVTGDISYEGFTRERIAIQIEVSGERFDLISVFNGERGWVTLNGSVMEMDAENLAEARRRAYLRWVTTLVPLQSADFKLSSRGEVEVDGRPALGIIVTKADHKEVQLYFDKRTYLLVKTEERVRDTSGIEVIEEIFLSNHELSGARQARKTRTTRNGNPFADSDTTSLETLEKLDDSLFQYP